MSVTKRPAPFDRRQHLRQARDIAARENVFPDPGVGRAGHGVAPDRVQQHHAVVLEQAADVAGNIRRNRLTPTCSNMPTETMRSKVSLDVAIVLQAKIERARRSPSLARPLRRHGELLLRQRDAGDLRARRRGEIERHAAEAAADVERGCALVDSSLAAIWRFLASLGLLERLPGMLEIGAGILPVGVEEEIVEPLVVIVVAGDVRLRPLAVVALMQAAERDAGLLERLDPGQALDLGEVARAQLEKVVEVALGDDEPAVHVEFAEIAAPDRAAVRRSAAPIVSCTPSCGPVRSPISARPRPQSPIPDRPSEPAWPSKVAKSRDHGVEKPSSLRADLPTDGIPLITVKLKKVETDFQEPFRAGHCGRGDLRWATSWFGPIRQGMSGAVFPFAAFAIDDEQNGLGFPSRAICFDARSRAGARLRGRAPGPDWPATAASIRRSRCPDGTRTRSARCAGLRYAGRGDTGDVRRSSAGISTPPISRR